MEDDPLSAQEIGSFIERGFVVVRDAFPRAIADEVCQILWRESGYNPNDPASWVKPAIRLNAHAEPPFLAAAATQKLTRAFDQLVGCGRWSPPESMATFLIRFPSPLRSGDTDWHVDMSFGPHTSDKLQWRANVFSEGRALLMLFLFSDVGPDDAPTRLKVGSHLDVARLLAPAGRPGLSLGDLIRADFGRTDEWSEDLAIGEAGTVFLCHPFLVHAGQDNPKRPRFLGQPALIPRKPMRFAGPRETLSPIERVVRKALGT